MILAGAERRCPRCGGVIRRGPRARWCSETCRVAAWHERRVRAGLSGPGAPVESRGIPVLRVLLAPWERAVDALAVPRRSDCEQALRHARSATRAALDMLEAVLRQAR